MLMLFTTLYAKKYIVTTTTDSTIMHVNALKSFEFPSHKGFQVDMSEDDAKKYADMDGVLHVEEDHQMKTMDIQTENVPWGLTRISHRAVDKSEYVYPSNAGEQVTVYIIDTGINANHEEFEGRAMAGQDFTEDQDGIDGNGHGTHCAGTIGGKTYGIAKKAHLIGVKVLSKRGYGSTTGVIQGIEWAFKHHKSRGKGAKSVINMSLGGGKSMALNKAIEAASKAGVVVSVAAGNENQDACNVSPASSEYAITVGATTAHDNRAWFSNWGTCTDILAPGYKVKSAWIGSTTATNIISGTSMASPHVAGVSAVYLSDNEEHLSPEDIRKLLIKMSTKDVVQGLPNEEKTSKWEFPWEESPEHGKKGSTPNRLLFHPATKVFYNDEVVRNFKYVSPSMLRKLRSLPPPPPMRYRYRPPPTVRPGAHWLSRMLPPFFRQSHRGSQQGRKRHIPKRFVAKIIIDTREDQDDMKDLSSLFA